VVHRFPRPVLTGLVVMVFLVGSAVEAGVASAASTADLDAHSQPAAQAAVELPDEYEGFDPESSELVDRDEYSNVYQNEDGTFTSEISIEPVNVPDGDDWAPASDEITHDSSGWEADNHPLSPEFAAHADDAMTASHGGSDVTFTLEGAEHSHIQRVPGTDDAVLYEDAIEGADLRYDAQGAAVKETLVLDEEPAVSSWTWDIHAPGLVFAKNELGDLEFTDGDGAVQFHIPAPVVWDSSGEDQVREPALASLDTAIVTDGDDYKLVLTADPLWLADAARVYPVYVDPTLTAGDSSFHAYKSDGATRTDAVHVGNSRDSNTNKYWRSQANYGYSSLSGKQVIDGSFKATYVSGTTSSFSGGIYVGTCHGYSGCYGDKLGTVTVGSGSTTVNDDRIAAQYAEWVDAGSFSHYLTSRGAETAGSYTYKQLNTSLSLTYKSFPSISGINGDSPANGATTTTEPTLNVAAVAPSGVSIFVRYLVSTTPTFTEDDADYVSDWILPGAIQLGQDYALDPDLTYYWKAQVKDTYDGLYDVSTLRSSATWSFVTSNEAPSVPELAGVHPAARDGEALVVGVAPTFGVNTSDSDSPQLQAEVQVFSDDGFGEPASLVSSCTSGFGGEDSVLACALEEGALEDGLAYHIRAQSYDGHEYSGWSAWTDTTASNAVVDEVPDFVEKSLDFDHAISLGDAIDVMGDLQYDVVGYEFDNDDVFGAYYLGAGYSPASFLTEFASDYDTVPQVTSVVVNVPAIESTSFRLVAGDEPVVISTSKPSIDAPLADGPAVAAFDASMDEVASSEAELPEEPAPGGVGQLGGPTLSRWDPGVVRTKIIKAGNSTAKQIKFVNYYYWDGVTSSPKYLNNYKTYNVAGQLTDYTGLEFDNSVWGNYYSETQMRCQVYAADCFNNNCDVPASRTHQIALNYGYSYTIRVGADDAHHSGNRTKLGTYKDTNDVWDRCNRNSIAIGMQHPEQLLATSSADPSFRLYISVTSAKGSNSGNSNVVVSGIQPVTGLPCINNTWQSKTDCMGAVPRGTFEFVGSPKSRPILGKVRGWTAPSLCWESRNYGKTGTPPVTTTPCAANPVPWS
jgi:hypothetical protein